MKTISILFSPIKIGTIEIPNRFARAATHDFMASRNGAVTERQVSLFKNLAKGEVGLIITGHAYVNPAGIASPLSVHKYPSRIFLQISHAGRQTKPKICGCTPLAPSSVYEPTFEVRPKEMDQEEIKSVIDDFIQSSRRAKEAGFDGVELHVAHGYLLSSFISPYTNRRKDEWGGTLTNRLRIVVEIIQGIKELLGKEFPLIVKLNSSDFLPEGLNIDESIEIAKNPGKRRH